MIRRAAKIDANQPEIVQALRDAGASVWIIGLPVDLLVGYKGRNFLMEVKDGSKPKSQKKLTSLQENFFSDWTGQVVKVETVDQALQCISQ